MLGPILQIGLLVAVLAIPVGAKTALAGLSSKTGNSAIASTETDQTLDDLFRQLRAADTQERGRAIEKKIWLHWTTHPDPKLNKLMQDALAARRWRAYDEAVQYAKEIIAADPDYAEAWNQLATIHFFRGEYEKSLNAIYETLVREPRHFGALAGRAIIRFRQNKPALAVQNLKAAIDLHPHLKERPLYDQLMGAGNDPKPPPSID